MWESVLSINVFAFKMMRIKYDYGSRFLWRVTRLPVSPL